MYNVNRENFSAPMHESQSQGQRRPFPPEPMKHCPLVKNMFLGSKFLFIGKNLWWPYFSHLHVPANLTSPYFRKEGLLNCADVYCTNDFSSPLKRKFQPWNGFYEDFCFLPPWVGRLWSWRPAYSPVLYQIKSAIAKLLVSFWCQVKIR